MIQTELIGRYRKQVIPRRVEIALLDQNVTAIIGSRGVKVIQYPVCRARHHLLGNLPATDIEEAKVFYREFHVTLSSNQGPQAWLVGCVSRCSRGHVYAGALSYQIDSVVNALVDVSRFDLCLGIGQQ